ncbi:MAG: ATP-binding protein [Thermodesulfobacteriota bacterium]
MRVAPIEEDTIFLRKTISDLREEVDQLTMLQDMSKQILSNYNFDQIINIFFDIIKELIGYNSCILYLYDEDSNAYQVSKFRNISGKGLKGYKLDHEIINWVLKEGRWTDISFFEHPSPKRKDLVSILPLQGAERNLGFLLTSSDPEKHVFTQSNMKRLSFIASQTGIALENQDLYSKLSRSREYTKNILESINSGIITIDMANKITQINKNVTAMLGLPSADIIGLKYRNALAKDLVKMIDKVKKQALKDGFAFEILFDYFPAKDLRIPLGITSSVLLDDEFNRIGIIIVFRNMLALKELERLRQLDELKSEFVSNVSHELRSPISVIKSYVETLLDQVDSSDYQTQREFLTVVNNETDRLAALVSDLLDISRIESGKFEMELSPVALTDIVQGVLRSLGDKGGRHKMAIDIPSDLPDISGDADKMIQVFLNLIDNAIKFSPDGGKISIKAGVKGKMVRCDISDQGIGIAKRDFLHIFKKFHRIDNSDKYEISGTGLGLSIVKHIIESHRGKISARSKPGKGSTFTISLPLGRG